MWFGRTRIKISGQVTTPLGETYAAVRARVTDEGGTVDGEHGNTFIASFPIYRIMGRGYLFGTWYGKAPTEFRFAVFLVNADSPTKITIECDLAAVELRFRWVFGILSALVMLPVITRGWRGDPAILLALPLPYIICWGNFLALKLFLPGKMRRFFQIEGCWWDQ